jgi:hypothetical protein
VYAGNGDGLNNPDMCDVADVGPIPQGMYSIGDPISYQPRLGKYVIPLTPMDGTTMFGRSGFFLHGDNASKPPFCSSDGCAVIEPESSRVEIGQSSDRILEVVA